MTVIKKIKWKHLALNSYSRMQVDLAVHTSFDLSIVKVLSATVAGAFANFGDPETVETER